jgi:predicted metallo-beta-lactamase superfamily hydrolase
MGSAMDVIDKKEPFKAYKEARELYVEQCNLAKQVKAALAELNRATRESAGTFRKSSKKAKEAAAMADATEPNLLDNFLLDLKKAC